MSSPCHIRRGSTADARALAELAARSFREAFEPLNDPADVQAYCDRWFTPQQIAAELAEEASTFFLAFAADGERPCGYAKLRAGDAEPAVRGASPVELERLYVGREALGKRVGAALMQACLAAAGRAGYETLWLGVWEHNERALAFYRRWGFEAVGEHPFVLGSDHQTDLVMERPVQLPVVR